MPEGLREKGVFVLEMGVYKVRPETQPGPLGLDAIPDFDPPANVTFIRKKMQATQILAAQFASPGLGMAGPVLGMTVPAVSMGGLGVPPRENGTYVIAGGIHQVHPEKPPGPLGVDAIPDIEARADVTFIRIGMMATSILEGRLAVPAVEIAGGVGTASAADEASEPKRSAPVKKAAVKKAAVKKAAKKAVGDAPEKSPPTKSAKPTLKKKVATKKKVGTKKHVLKKAVVKKRVSVKKAAKKVLPKKTAPANVGRKKGAGKKSP